MNKKFITILLIIGILTAGLGLVSANETLTDNSAAATQENAESDASQTTQTAQADNQSETQNDENITETNETNETEAVEEVEEEYNMSQIKELISTMNDTQINALAHYLKVNNINGQYNDIIAILESDSLDLDKLMESIDKLEDTDFLTFADLLDMVLKDDTIYTPTDTNKNTPTKNTPSSKNPVNTILEKTGTSNAITTITNIFNPKQNSKNSIKEIVTGPTIEDLICESLDAYFKGRITFNELLNELKELGVDTSLVKDNGDGSLTIDGKVIASVQDFLDALNEDDNSTNSTTNDTSVNDTAANNTNDDATSDTASNSDSEEHPADDANTTSGE